MQEFAARLSILDRDVDQMQAAVAWLLEKRLIYQKFTA